MAFEFYIQDVLVDQPMGDLDLSTKIRRDDDIGGMVITQEASLQWVRDNNVAPGYTSGYQTLKDLFDDGLCNEAAITIYSRVSDTVTYLVHRGIIKVPQLEFDEKWLSVSTKIQDNSFYSYIYNNRNLKVDLRAIQTKNKQTIDELQHYEVDFFNGCTGVWGSVAGFYYKGYLIQDMLEFIIAVITDNGVGFQSDYLDNLEYPLIIFKGESLLNPFSIYPTSNPVFELSLQEVVTELNKLKNLYFYIDQSDPASPVFRLEAREETYSEQVSVTLSEPLNLKTTVDSANLFGKVIVGSEITVDGDNSTGCIYTMNEASSYFGFKIEEFFPLGQCNTGNELNIVNEWIISNNVIQDIIIGQSENYLDDYVLVECDGVDLVAFTANAHPFDFYGQATPPVFYNLGLNNYNKLQRHSSKFETVFGNFLGIGSLGFRALLGEDPTQDITYSNSSLGTNPIPPGGLTVDSEFVNETTNGGYDGSNNYDNVAYEYTVPQDGDYSFHQRLHIESANNIATTDFFTVSAIIIQYDSGMVQKSISIGSINVFSDGFFFCDGTLVANCQAGDIIKAFYNITYNFFAGNPQVARTLTIIWDSYFECNGTPDGGVTITSGNPSIKKLLHEFQYHLNDTDWRLILANPTGMVPFVKDGVTRYGWIQEMIRSEQTGLTQIKLISSNATA